MTKAATAQLFVQERHFSRALKETLLVSKRRGAAASDVSQLLLTGRLSDRCSYYSHTDAGLYDHTRLDVVLANGELSQTSVYIQNFSHDGELQQVFHCFDMKSLIRTFVLRKRGV